MYPTGHPLPSRRRSPRGQNPWELSVCLIGLLLVITSCATPPVSVKKAEPSAVITGEQPAPLEGEQLDIATIETLSKIARDQSLLAARYYRNEAVTAGIDASTLMAIDSRLAWYSGDTQRAARLIDTLATDNTASLGFVREDKEYRAAAAGDWLGAASAVYQQATAGTTLRKDAALGERLFQYLLRLPDPSISGQLDRPTTDPVWRRWLEMQLAYRDDRARFAAWLARNAELMTHPPIPRHLFEWAQDHDMGKVAIILPLEGSLTVAGEAVLAGTVEQLYALYPDPANRPALSTINSAQYSSAKDA